MNTPEQSESPKFSHRVAVCEMHLERQRLRLEEARRELAEEEKRCADHQAAKLADEDEYQRCKPIMETADEIERDARAINQRIQQLRKLRKFPKTPNQNI